LFVFPVFFCTFSKLSVLHPMGQDFLGN
jgi:hypothetical protein